MYVNVINFFLLQNVNLYGNLSRVFLNILYSWIFFFLNEYFIKKILDGLFIKLNKYILKVNKKLLILNKNVFFFKMVREWNR